MGIFRGMLLRKDELLLLFDAYNNGEYSFAEVLLASGMGIKDFAAFMREHDIEIKVNLDFMEKGRGLNEDALRRIMEMNKDDEEI
jgi:hypothetical protein